jgi:hypothetical protein
MRAATAVAILGACSLAGCFSTTQEGSGVLSSGGAGGAGGCVGTSCHKGIGGGSGGGAGSTGAAAAGTSGGSSAGGTSGGDSGGGSGSNGGTTAAFSVSDGGLDAGVSCPDVYLASTVIDIQSQEPIVGATISAFGLNGVPIQGASAATQADGSFVVCVPSNVTFSLEFTATGYQASVLEDTLLTKSETVVFFYNGIPLVPQELMAVVEGFVPGVFNTSQGAVLVSVNSLSGTAPCQNASGWQLSLSQLDGGALPDGGFQMVYLSSSLLPSPGLQVTASNGDALFYDIDPNLVGRVAIQAVDTNADAGECPIVSDQIGLQGTALVAGQLLTFGPIMVP